MRYVQSGKVVGVDSVLELRDGRVDEEGWVRRAGAAPDYVWRSTLVERSSFRDYAGAFRGRGEVGAYVVEALLGGRGSALLGEELAGTATAARFAFSGRD